MDNDDIQVVQGVSNSFLNASCVWLRYRSFYLAHAARLLDQRYLHASMLRLLRSIQPQGKE